MINNLIIMSIVEKPFRRLFAALFLLFIVLGISMTIIGATLPRILEDFDWTYAEAGIVIAAGAVGFFSANFLAGNLIKHIGIRTTIISGIVVLFIGLMFFARTSSLVVNVFLNLAIGIGQGFLELVVNYATIRMERPGSGRAMNLVHGAFSIGAVTGPFVIGLLLNAALPWAFVYRGIAVIFILFAFTIPLLPLDLIKDGPDKINNKKKVSLVRHPAYWLGFTSLLLYVGVELGISNWIAEYFVTVFFASPAQGSFMVSLFWVGLLFGRIGVPLFYKGERSDVLLIASSLLMTSAIIGLTIVGFLEGGALLVRIASILVALAGFGCALVYPVVITFIGTAFPDNQGVAIGFSSMGGGIGAFIFPFIMSNVSSAYGIRTGFATYAFFSVISVISSLMLVKVVKSKKYETAS